MKDKKNVIIISLCSVLTIIIIICMFMFIKKDNKYYEESNPNILSGNFDISAIIKKINKINGVYNSKYIDFENDKAKYTDRMGFTCYTYNGDNKSIEKELNEIYSEPFSIYSNVKKNKRGEKEIIYFCKFENEPVTEIKLDEVKVSLDKKDKKSLMIKDVRVDFEKIDGKWKTQIPVVIYE